ncbi:MAG: hypothetical protein A2W97_18950 [Bacteroidetes bacterium GWE2_40_63]|jgi:hypothetical protein|nr:MAG: hypothetical protein A2W95_02215 [Bacteroidetes bacterium GWA2_40_14]OFX57058.1 MAG: hypothetical protein A2W84_12030 [Bacteroidetes bacterium GWC2_40_13]OFX72184.1 MAG: hypothetical protein A2W96_05750 [Bacteroidetes bacterium GWD2_40_43]OFX94250.1 MAG: hypothetical protein A2W97_18950 [Bacteroidetes bacterium GWE2_40_63]OFY23681.1 MAG: hypothetical protein A2W88_12890 [Bacteroidetes bacterium GWF2_40_13]OFZ25244.1 MAG: hypothetical protein A2437_07635 [Bacteroidetes bacterium RIFOXYC
MRYWFYLACLFLSAGMLKAQDCSNYLEEHCKPEQTKFKYQVNGASTSFSISSNEFWTLPLNLNENMDYRISLCCDSIFEGVLLFVIKNEDGKELYNNSGHLFQNECEFTSPKNQTVFFEVTAPQPTYIASDTIYSEGCAALLIEEMKTYPTGF